MLVPGIFELLEKVIGPMLTSTAASSIAKGVIGLGSSASASGVLGVIEGAVGKLEDAKVTQIHDELQTLLAQCQLIQSDSKSGSIVGNWHAVFCFGMSVICLTHFAVAELFNILVSLHVSNIGLIAPLDTAALAFMGGVLGVGIGCKTVEKVNSNSDQSGN